MIEFILALAPLYRGKALAFVLENRDASGVEIEKNVEAICLSFESLKPYLLEMWETGK